MRERLAQAAKLRYTHQQQRWLLDAVDIYCAAVSSLAKGLDRQDVKSRGLQAYRERLAGYTTSDLFTSLVAETRQLKDDLATVRYSVHIKGTRVTVSRYGGEADYSGEVEETFERFKHGDVKDYRVAFPEWPDISHVEARVLELVARLYPDIFLRARRLLHPSPGLSGRDDRRLRPRGAVLSGVSRVHRALHVIGAAVLLPGRVRPVKEISAHDAFDIALADKLVPEDSPVVCNDFYLKDPERILVVTGPNQGGKTTFARMFGQLHYLASLGYPCPAARHSSLCRTACSLISRRRRISQPCGASSRMT